MTTPAHQLAASVSAKVLRLASEPPTPQEPMWGVPSADGVLDPVELRLEILQLTLDLLGKVHELPLVSAERLIKVSAELFDLILGGHVDPSSSVAGRSEGNGAAGSSGPAAPSGGDAA